MSVQSRLSVLQLETCWLFGSELEYVTTENPMLREGLKPFVSASSGGRRRPPILSPSSALASPQ
jgi:hypothetical protein